MSDPINDPTTGAAADASAALTAMETRLKAQLEDFLAKRAPAPAAPPAEPAPPAPPPAPPPAGLSHADLKAALDLQTGMHGLPAAHQQHLHAIAAQQGYQAALKALELINLGRAAAPAPAANPAAPTPRPPEEPWPTTRKALRELALNNPKRFAELMSPDHDFDPSVLKRHTGADVDAWLRAIDALDIPEGA
jgi:hypothetical protein